MRVQIQYKSSLNQKTDRYMDRIENNRGGKEWAGLSFPTPLFQISLTFSKISKLEFLLDIFQS